MKCLIVITMALVAACAGDQSHLPNQYGYIPRTSNQDALISYVAVNNPVLLRQDPIYLHQQVPQVDIVSHRGSFSHYVHPRNYQSFQASLQSSAIPSNVVALTRGGSIIGQPLVAFQGNEGRIDIPNIQQGPQQNSQPIPQGRLTSLGGPSAQFVNLSTQRGPISNIQRQPISVGQRGQNQNGQPEQLPRRQ